MSVQEHRPDSTLNLYRRALALRGDLFAGTEVSWVDSEPSVLHFERRGGVWCVTNFGAEPNHASGARCYSAASSLPTAGCPATQPPGCECGSPSLERTTR